MKGTSEWMMTGKCWHFFQSHLVHCYETERHNFDFYFVISTIFNILFTLNGNIFGKRHTIRETISSQKYALDEANLAETHT